MFVAELRTYMLDADGTGEKEPISRISMHESTKGDGVYDRHTVFVDKLVDCRASITPLDGNAILTMETDTDDIYKYTDTNNDGVADKKELFFKGAGRDRQNLEHQPSGFIWGMDNWIYSTYNAFRLRWTPKGEVLKEPTAPNGGQWGLTQDDYGKVWFVDAGGERGPINFQTPIQYGAFNVDDQFDDRLPRRLAGLPAATPTRRAAWAACACRSACSTTSPRPAARTSSAATACPTTCAATCSSPSPSAA